jgi:hypothetical protein
MQGKHWLIVVSVLFLTAFGCQTRNPYNCPQGNKCKPDARIPAQCGNVQCNLSTPVCKDSKTCVECTLNEDCTPRFCSAKNTCVECVTHDDCSSKLCLNEGTCATSEEVAYVNMSPPSSMMCSLAMPCQHLGDALNLIPPRKYIKVTGIIIDDKAILIENKSVAIYGGVKARLDRSNGGPILHLRSQDTAVSIYDIEITGQEGASEPAIKLEQNSGNPILSLSRVKIFSNVGRGISADGGSLTISQSTVSANSGGGISMVVVSGNGAITLTQSTILGNTGGGISISGAEFDITNSIIAKNGSATSIFGGVKIDSIGGIGIRRFDFNTVAENQATGLNTPGVLCSAIATELPFTNSIVYGTGTVIQVEGPNCSWSYSDIGPTGATGTGNINALPMFISPSLDNFHLQSGSPAKDMANPVESMVTSDIDGDERPQGAARDMGADEIR